jgi:predicted NUDIX family phosphoesterase
MDKNIMVVHVDKLFGEYPRKSGFYTPEFKFENVILENFEYMKRKLAEENVNYKQPLPYAILRTQDDRLFVYQRGDENSQV